MGKSIKHLFKPALTIDVRRAKIETRRILEINPNKLRAGEIGIIKASKWCGLKNECFAVLNVDGKYVLVEQL